MCGIFAILDHHRSVADARALALGQSRTLRHRGPDWSGLQVDERFALAHERLAIVDPFSGEQPLTDPTGQRLLAVNGEIYNHRTLRDDVRRTTPSRPVPTARSSCPSTTVTGGI